MSERAFDVAAHAAPQFRPGLEVALESPPPILRDARRIGLLFNQASVDREFRLAHELLHSRLPGRLAALFSPQHGLFAEQQDNMVESAHGRDPLTGAPVHSLYSETRRPRADWLRGLDLFVVDLQDVGCRVYTFVWTVSHCLEACAEAGVPVLVLDRPNPLGGEVVEGAWLDPKFSSFVGRASMPMRHELTMGELALWLNTHMNCGAHVEVVKCDGWRRSMTWRDLGRPWVPTSPNLPRIEGVDVYPGQVLLEGTNLSEGRGTTTPFEVCGAPFVDSWRLRDALAEFAAEDCERGGIGSSSLDAVVFRPIRFEPTFQKWKGQSCGGVFLHPRDVANGASSRTHTEFDRSFRSYRTTLVLLATIARLWPRDFAWKAPPYEYEQERTPIDCITGGDRVRHFVERARAAGSTRSGAVDLAELDRLCDARRDEWRARTKDARLYE
jgi:uncharacterized protein YbbC (DUF1343 family)